MVNIPYKSTGAAMSDLLSGQVPIIVGSLLPVVPFFESGKLRAPAAIISRLNAAINKALEQPDMKKNLEVQGMIATGGTPEKFGERVRRDYDRWVKLVDEVKIKVE